MRGCQTSRGAWSSDLIPRLTLPRLAATDRAAVAVANKVPTYLTVLTYLALGTEDAPIIARRHLVLNDDTTLLNIKHTCRGHNVTTYL